MDDNMIKAIIFDLDGTLVNTEPLHFRAWRDTIINNGGKEFTFDLFITYVGTSNEKIAGDAVRSHNIAKTIEELIKEKQQRYMQMIPEIQLFEGAKEIISDFHSQYKLAVASSSHTPEIYAILKRHNIFDKMSAIYGADMITHKKPNPEIYLKTAAALQVDPTDCLAFEDSNPGITAARAAGMYGIAIPNELTRHHDFSPASLILQSFNEVDQQTIEHLEATDLHKLPA